MPSWLLLAGGVALAAAVRLGVSEYRDWRTARGLLPEDQRNAGFVTDAKLRVVETALTAAFVMLVAWIVYTFVWFVSLTDLPPPA